MYATYARKNEGELLTRVGHRVKSLQAAATRAKKLATKLAMLEVEVRAEHLPRARSLLAICYKGRWVEGSRLTENDVAQA